MESNAKPGVGDSKTRREENLSQMKVKLPEYVVICLVAADKTVYIRKTTAIWLLQQGEMVSTDRLFRVRKTQPYHTTASETKTSAILQPTAQTSIEVGDMCVFLKAGTTKWRIGRVLKFAYYMAKKKGSRMYRGNARTVTDKNIGVLYTWYSNKDPSTATFSIIEDKKLHAYQPIFAYVCTLSTECFDSINESKHSTLQSITKTSSLQIYLLTAKQFTLAMTYDQLSKIT